MLLRDIDKALDMQCKLVLKGTGKIFTLSRNLNIEIPLLIFEKADEFRAYLEKSKENEDISNYVGAREENGMYVIDNILVDSVIRNMIYTLNKIKSVSPQILTIDSGNIVTRLRFHHDYLKEVTETIAEFVTPSREKIIEIDIEPCKGLSYLFENRNKKTPVSVLSFEVPVNIYDDENVLNIMRKGSIIELSNDKVSEGGRRAILFSSSNPGDLTPIAKNIYGISVKNLFLNSLSDLADFKGIRLFHIFGRLENERIKIIVFLKTIDVSNYLAVLFSLIKENSLDIYLSLCQRYDYSIWEFL